MAVNDYIVIVRGLILATHSPHLTAAEQETRMTTVYQAGPAVVLGINATVFTVVQGDVLEQGAEAVLCYSSSALTLHSHLAQQIVARGGPAIRVEGLKHAPAAPGSVLALPAGRLASRHLLVAVTNALRDAPTLDALHRCMHAVCTHIAHHGLRSIAVPFLRAGRALGPEETVRAMLAPLIDHCCGPTPLKQVFIVVDAESELGLAPRLGHYLAGAFEGLRDLGWLRAQAAALREAEQLLLPFELPSPAALSEALRAQLDLQLELLFHLDQLQARRGRDDGAVLVELELCAREIDRLSAVLEGRRAATLRERALGE